MAFNSIEFAVFLGTVYLLYRLLGHRWQNYGLLGASYVFYGSWDWRFLSLIVLSTVIDYSVGLALANTESAERRRRLVTISIASNLGILGIFKYFGFFASSLTDLLAMAGMSMDWVVVRIVLPVGISFYTFQTMSYTIDIYRGRLEPTTRFFDFALFVAFFPQLVAGPIERASNLLPMVLKPRRLCLDSTTRGAYLILLGLFKKIVVADGVAPSVSAIFGAGEGVSAVDVWLATMLFAVQIYGDFSGYSDIARGVSKLLGFDLMENFRLPYFSTSPQEFWNRWHISLSSWLRDYLYVPLGGNRRGAAMTYRNLLATMVLGGLWHGAAWNFVLWGLYQGLLLCVHRLWARRWPARTSKWLRPFKMSVFFLFTCYGWMLFRAGSLPQVVDFTRLMFGTLDFSAIAVPRPPLATMMGIPLLLALDALHLVSDSPRFYRSWPSAFRGLLFASLVWLTIMGLSNAPSEFIYFQF